MNFTWLWPFRGKDQELSPLAKVDAAAIIRKARRLRFRVRRGAVADLAGAYVGARPGSGLAFAELRPYEPGDDVRHMDWNVTARLDHPHVRVFTEDREMSAWFLLDLSPSVDFGSGTQAKRDVSSGFVASLARLLTKHGNKVGAMLYGGGADAVIPPKSSRRHVLHLLHSMRHPELMAKDAQPGVTKLAELLQHAAGLMRRRSTVFVVSDFISEPGWEKPLSLLARRHEVVAVRLLDPLELELPDLGLIPIRDVETGEQLMVDTHDPGFRHRFARIAAQREADLRASLMRAGVDALELSTEDDLTEALLRFVEMRKRRARLPSHLKAA